MKYLIIALLGISTYTQITYAQTDSLINSGAILQKCDSLYDSSDYKGALRLAGLISRNDSNYVRALYSKALICEADSQYSQAIEYCKEGLAESSQREFELNLYNTYGNTLNEMGQHEKAIEIFNTAISIFQSSSLLNYNKGIVLLATKHYEDAEVQFQKALLLNPYQYSAHYQLGIAALLQGKIVPAFLSFLGYTLVNHEGKYWSKSVNLLSGISNAKDEILDYKNHRTNPISPEYEEIEEILLSKIALDKSYKPIISLDDPISRQIQAVFEKMEYQQKSKDFWVQYYLPYYKQLYKDGDFELFINFIFSKATVSGIQEFNRKHKKELDAFASKAGKYFDLIKSTRELNYSNRDTFSIKYIYSEGSLAGRGALSADGKLLIGSWQFLFPDGKLKSLGQFNEKGERVGDWFYYRESGKLKSFEHYVNGKLEGEQRYYFGNENTSSTEAYRDGKQEGVTTLYYYGGNKKSLTHFQGGNKYGEEIIYFPNGVMKSVANYSNGKINGKYLEFYNSGQPYSETNYKEGKEDGFYKSYYEQGGLSIEGESKNDKAEGTWKYYYENGKLKEKKNFINNRLEGVDEEYYENGKTEWSHHYTKGKLNGENISYDTAGKVFIKELFENGEMKSVTFFNKSGEPLSHSELVDGRLDVLGYSIEGFKNSHTHYNKLGEIEGTDTLFYPSGKVNEVNQYSNGTLNGPSVSFYLNGNKKTIANYTDGKLDGHTVNYYFSGRKESEGWHVGGQMQGDWRFYNQSGSLSRKEYYLDGDLDGYKEEFNISGKLAYETKYKTGWIEKFTQYDTNGKIMLIDSFPKGDGKFVVLNDNGKKRIEVEYVHGELKGAYHSYYFDGSPENSFFYRNALFDSTYTSYYFGGDDEFDGHHQFGKKTGLWEYHEERGKYRYRIMYEADKRNGKCTFISAEGNKDLECEYKNDMLNGLLLKYDVSGTLAYAIYYVDDVPKSYTYLSKDGNQLPMIPIDPQYCSLKAYFPNGNLSRQWSYSDGVVNGIDILYYMNGQVRSIDSTIFDQNVGVSKTYYPNGKLKSEYPYVDYLLNGIGKEYDQEGGLLYETSLLNGEKHGATRFYDAKGKLLKTANYSDGTLLSVKYEK